MPKIGEIKWQAMVIKGKTYEKGKKFIWLECLGCGKGRWVQHAHSIRRNFTGCCFICAHRLGGWGVSGICGKHITPRGYWMVKLDPSDFFYPMCNKMGGVLEHRLAVAKALGRNLHLWEIVHHKGAKYRKGSLEDKQDNRYPENLQLVTDDRHNQITLLERRIKYLERKLKEKEVAF